MKRSIMDLLREVAPQRGNGGRTLARSGNSKDAEPARSTPIDKTTAAAKLICESELSMRTEKTARLKAAREARDQQGDTSLHKTTK